MKRNRIAVAVLALSLFGAPALAGEGAECQGKQEKPAQATPAPTTGKQKSDSKQEQTAQAAVTPAAEKAPPEACYPYECSRASDCGYAGAVCRYHCCM